VFTKEPNSPLPDKGPSPHPSMSSTNKSIEDIYNLLLNPHNACGSDQIHGRVLRETANVIISPFLDLGAVLEDWLSTNFQA